MFSDYYPNEYGESVDSEPDEEAEWGASSEPVEDQSKGMGAVILPEISYIAEQ